MTASYTSSIESYVTSRPITIPASIATLRALIGKRVCVHYKLMSITGRVEPSTTNAVGVSVENGMSYADVRIYPEFVDHISLAARSDTDSVIAYIYLK